MSVWIQHSHPRRSANVCHGYLLGNHTRTYVRSYMHTSRGPQKTLEKYLPWLISVCFILLFATHFVHCYCSQDTQVGTYLPTDLLLYLFSRAFPLLLLFLCWWWYVYAASHSHRWARGACLNYLDHFDLSQKDFFGRHLWVCVCTPGLRLASLTKIYLCVMNIVRRRRTWIYSWVE